MIRSTLRTSAMEHPAQHTIRLGKGIHAMPAVIGALKQEAAVANRLRRNDARKILDRRGRSGGSMRHHHPGSASARTSARPSRPRCSDRRFRSLSDWAFGCQAVLSYFFVYAVSAGYALLSAVDAWPRDGVMGPRHLNLFCDLAGSRLQVLGSHRDRLAHRPLRNDQTSPFRVKLVSMFLRCYAASLSGCLPKRNTVPSRHMR